MRRQPTEPELRLWRHLSNSQLGGFKFRRQARPGFRIADFFCPSIGLIVEIDGDTHDPAIDARKDAVSRQHGFHIIRFSNSDVMQNMDGVLASLLSFARSLPSRTNWRLPHPNPASDKQRPTLLRSCWEHDRPEAPEGEGL